MSGHPSTRSESLPARPIQVTGQRVIESLRALALELPGPVWDDHAKRINELLDAIAEAIQCDSSAYRALDDAFAEWVLDHGSMWFDADARLAEAVAGVLKIEIQWGDGRTKTKVVYDDGSVRRRS